MMQHASFILTVVVSLTATITRGDHRVANFSNDATYSTVQLIGINGFQSEVHTVTTRDGYILSVFRIVSPGGRVTGPPVVLFHDFELSPAHYLIAGPTGNSIPIELAKQGYDVWLPSDRGSPESSAHVRYNAESDTDYWDYSLDDLSLTDTPAVIEYIRQVTGSATVGAIGHGQGATRLLMLLADRTICPFNEVLKPVIILSPILYYRLSLTPALQIPINSPWLIPYLKNIGGPLFRSRQDRDEFLDPVFRGLDTDQSMVSSYLSLPSSRASSNVAAQIIENGFIDFTFHYDYGVSKNLQVYGSPIPPLYLLQAISNPYVSFIISLTDEVLSPLDFTRVALEFALGFRRLYDLSIIADPFSHIDFAWGMSNNRNVISPILQLVQKLYW